MGMAARPVPPVPCAALTAIVILFLTAVTPVRSAAQSNGPVVRITLNDIPPYVFTPGSPPVQLRVAEPFHARITWTVDGALSAYGHETVVRYGWNVSAQGGDEAWAQSWCTACHSAPVRVLGSGTWRFLLEARDRFGMTTLAQIEIIVAPVAIEAATWGDVKARFTH